MEDNQIVLRFQSEMTKKMSYLNRYRVSQRCPLTDFRSPTLVPHVSLPRWSLRTSPKALQCSGREELHSRGPFDPDGFRYLPTENPKVHTTCCTRIWRTIITALHIAAPTSSYMYFHMCNTNCFITRLPLRQIDTSFEENIYTLHTLLMKIYLRWMCQELSTWLIHVDST